ncbi:MAG: HlyC/CorC family transporter [Clostridia bacterium]|nr:HlyC/CorC family transporter [Clostridia bacterium]
MDPLWGQLILQFILIFVNAIFACSEMAVVSLNEKKMEKLAEDGNKKAAKLLKMLQNPDRFLSTIQISITLAGFLGSAFAADNIASRLTHWLYYGVGFTSLGEQVLDVLCVILITLILSYFTLILGELVPKRIAMKNPEKAAMRLCSVVRFFAVIFRPVVWFLSVSTNLVLKMLRIDPKHEDEEVTEEEIRMMVESSEEDGNIQADEKEMIENIFEFNNTTAADIMTHRTEMTAIDINDSFEDIIKTINETGYSRFPVYEDDIDNIIGVLSTRRFLLNVCEQSPKTLKELIFEPNFVPESVRADLLFRDMQEKKTHMAIILDEYGGTAGLVTMEDLIEQIVGNIYDETDEQFEDEEIEQIGENLYRMDGSVALDTVEEALDIDFPPEDDDLSTLSGLIFSRFTTIPADGETPELTIDRLHIKVEEITEHRVVSAVVELLPKEENEEDEE